MQVSEVTVKPIEIKSTEISEVCYRNCKFCDRIVKIFPTNSRSCGNLSGKLFHCPFCLRHNHHYKNSFNVLILSYRSIIGCYYHKYYLQKYHNVYTGFQYHKPMYLAEIQKIIDNHRTIGLRNPVFSYDASTYYWFIDFNKVGNHKKKAPYEEIEDTAKLILREFQLNKYMNQTVEQDFWNKMQKALKLFYKERKRPQGKKILIPTFMESNAPKHVKEFYEVTRDFIPGDLQLI